MNSLQQILLCSELIRLFTSMDPDRTSILMDPEHDSGDP